MDLIDRKAAVARMCGISCGCTRDMCGYGESGCARVQFVEEMPTVHAVPMDKLCKWLAVCTDDPPCISLRYCDCGIVCREKKPSDAECWKTVLTKWKEGLDAAYRRRLGGAQSERNN